MSEPTFVPISTSIGLLRGRDATYLHSLHLDGSTLILEGECNGRLATQASEQSVRYTLRFLGVLAFRVTELDSWLHGSFFVLTESSFGEVVDSQWQAGLGGKVTPSHRFPFCHDGGFWKCEKE